MQLLRPAYDAACASLTGTPNELSASQSDALWQALVPSHAYTQTGHQRWTPAASLLLVPLRRERNTVRSQRVAGRWQGACATAPGKPDVDLDQQHRRYEQRLADLYKRLTDVLQANGHFCLASDEHHAQPIAVIVANERAQGRAAGTLDWTQWEDPATVRVLTRMFAAGPKAKRGANWSPYMPNGTRKRGSAAESKLTKLWRGAFHDAIADPLAVIASTPHAGPLVRFYRSLQDAPTQQAIEDAIRAQTAAHCSPRNRAFAAPATIWLALADGPRTFLASQFDQALRECHEAALAGGSNEFSPAAIANPWVPPGEDTSMSSTPSTPSSNTLLDDTEPDDTPPSDDTEPDGSFLDRYTQP